MSSKLALLLRSYATSPGRACLNSVLGTQEFLRLSSIIESQRHFSTSLNFARYGFKRYTARHRKAIFNRRREVGPEPIRHRSVWPSWNYDTELFAFGARLGEVTTSNAFRQAFVHESYNKQEIERRKVLNIDDAQQLTVPHQEPLKKLGESLVSSYLPAICRFNYPYLPEEAIQLMKQHLLEVKTLANVSRHLGTSDLIQCADLPPLESTLADTLLAVIGALSQDAGTTRAQHFVLDFLVTSLLEVDVNELFQPKNPMGVVVDIMTRAGIPEPESRLLRQCGASTPEALFLIGIYSDKQLIGQSFGETLLIAEEMAARDTLSRLFRTTLSKKPLLFGERAKNFNFHIWSQVPNLKLADWSEKDCQNLLDSRQTVQPHLEAPERPRLKQAN